MIELHWHIEDIKGYEFTKEINDGLKLITSTRLEKFNNSYLNERLFEDLTAYMLPAFLRYEDKIGMTFYIKTRFLFLDYKLINFIFSLGMSNKIRKGWSKAILRDAIKGILHEEVRSRRDKKGYPTPIKNILQEMLGIMIGLSGGLFYLMFGERFLVLIITHR